MEAKKLLKFIVDEIGLQEAQTLLVEIKAELESESKTSDKQTEMEQFFLGILDGLEEEKTYDFPNSIFYRKKGKIYMEYDKKHAGVWLSYDLIWSVFHDRFGLNYSETREFIKTMLRKHKKIKDITTYCSDNF